MRMNKGCWHSCPPLTSICMDSIVWFISSGLSRQFTLSGKWRLFSVEPFPFRFISLEDGCSPAWSQSSESSLKDNFKPFGVFCDAVSLPGHQSRHVMERSPITQLCTSCLFMPLFFTLVYSLKQPGRMETFLTLDLYIRARKCAILLNQWGLGVVSWCRGLGVNNEVLWIKLKPQSVFNRSSIIKTKLQLQQQHLLTADNFST